MEDGEEKIKGSGGWREKGRVVEDGRKRKGSGGWREKGRVVEDGEKKEG